MKPSFEDSTNPLWRPSGSVKKSRTFWKKLLPSRLTGLVVIFLFVILIYMTDAATWAVRLTMGSLFCSLIYARDNSASGRWLAIGIIALGTLLSIFLPLLRN
jgi:hypothetical protein